MQVAAAAAEHAQQVARAEAAAAELLQDLENEQQAKSRARAKKQRQKQRKKVRASICTATAAWLSSRDVCCRLPAQSSRQPSRSQQQAAVQHRQLKSSMQRVQRQMQQHRQLRTRLQQAPRPQKRQSWHMQLLSWVDSALGLNLQHRLQIRQALPRCSAKRASSAGVARLPQPSLPSRQLQILAHQLQVRLFTAWSSAPAMSTCMNSM